MILQHHLNQEIKEVYLCPNNKWIYNFNNCVKPIIVLVYLKLFTFSGTRTNDTKRNVSAVDTGNALNQKETSQRNQVDEIGSFLSCSHSRYQSAMRGFNILEIFFIQQGYDCQGKENDLAEDESEFSLISKVKQAKHTAIVKAIKDDLTKEELEEEKRYI